jgi:hypothetical protein
VIISGVVVDVGAGVDWGVDVGWDVFVGRTFAASALGTAGMVTMPATRRRDPSISICLITFFMVYLAFLDY